MVVTQRTEESRAVEAGFTQQQAQMLQEISTKYGLDMGAAIRLGIQLRDLSSSAGLDLNLLMGVLRDAQRSGERGFTYSVPHTDTRTVGVGMDMLQHAFGTFSEGPPRTRPDFSASTVAAAAHDYFRDALFGHRLPVQIGEKTTTWLNRQADRNHLDQNALSTSVLGYCSLMRSNPELAEQYLRIASGGDARVASFARMFHQQAQGTVMEDGRTSFWLSTPDAVQIAGAFRRDVIFGSTISRSA